MKKILAAALAISSLCYCDIRHTKNDKESTDAKDKDSSAMVFKDSTSVAMIDSVYNFGKVTDGEKVEFNFRFRNTGKNPLIVTSAKASCGCTIPETPDEPIAPGEIGHIKAVFNSKGRVGEVHKEITVTSNAFPSFPQLKLEGEVVAKTL